MTWEMINNENELMASIATHAKHKNQITQEFEIVKDQVNENKSKFKILLQKHRPQYSCIY